MALQEQDASSPVQVVIDVPTARIMMTFLQAVTKFRHGCGYAATEASPGRQDGHGRMILPTQWFIGFSLP